MLRKDHSRPKVPSPRASYPGAPATFPDYCVDAHLETQRALADSIAAGTLEHTNLKTTFTELQARCRRSNIFAFWSMIEVVDVTLERVLANQSEDIYDNDLLRYCTEVSRGK